MERGSDLCDRCGEKKRGTGMFAAVYRAWALSGGLPDPGNLCIGCGRDVTLARRKAILAETLHAVDA